MLISLAVDYRRADVSVRERFHLTEERLEEFRALPAAGAPVRELVPVTTCNRTELYAWTDGHDPAVASAALEWLASRWAPMRADRLVLLHTAHHRYGDSVGRHLLRVAAGLESQVLGDAQILGQVRVAYRAAVAAGATGSVLHRLFETALRAGKRVSAETMLNAGRSTIGALAATLAASHSPSIQNARCVVVGCGKTGERVVRQLLKQGARDVVVLNRTPTRARELAAALGLRAAPWGALYLELALADIAIVATAADQPIVDAPRLQTSRTNTMRSGEPLLLVDIALPRNVEAAAGTLAGVTLVDLDALPSPASRSEEARREAVPVAEAIVESELGAFRGWLAAEAARAAIRPLHAAITEVCRREVAYAAGQQAAERAAQRIAAKLLARPMASLRAAIARGEPVDELALTMDQLFALSPTGTLGAPSSFAAD